MSGDGSVQDNHLLNDEDELKDDIPDKLLKLISESIPEEEKQKLLLKEVREAIVISHSTAAVMEMFKGPIPPPHFLQGYEEILPGSADRLIKMAEYQSAHRQEIEKIAISKQLNQSGRGQNYGFILAMTFLVAAFILIILGHETAGTIIGTVDLVALVSVFVIGKTFQRKDLRKKDPVSAKRE